MENVGSAANERNLPFTPLDQRLHAGGAPTGTRFKKPTKPSSWRAFSVRRPYLFVLLALSLSLLATIETLRRVNNHRHGIQHLDGSNPTSLTVGQTVLYSYIPTITAVIYSTLWSYVDSDTKRLEPYIQMRSSKSPANVLLLDYLFESPFATPVRALKRRHWTLAAVSLTFLLISVLLPASQGALFGIDRVSYSIDEDDFEISHQSLVSGTLAGGEFIDQARAISIPNGSKLPPWTTEQYAVDAFSPKSGHAGGNVTWTAHTIVYHAQPNCRRFEQEDTLLLDVGGAGVVIGTGPEVQLINDILLLANVSIADSPSCNLTVGVTIRMFWPLSRDNYLFPFFTNEFNSSGSSVSGITAVQVHPPKPGDATYGTVQNSSTPIHWRDPAISCPDRKRLEGLTALDFTHFNGSWDSDLPQVGLSLAWYTCEVQTNWTVARAAVDAKTQAVVGVDQFSQEASANGGINIPDFEALLEIGLIQPENILTANASEPGLWAIGQTQSIGDVVVNNLTSQVNPQSYGSLLADETVGDAFEAGYRLMFALTVNGFLQIPGTPTTTNGSIHVDTFAVVVVPAFAIISETLLSLAALVLIALLIGYNRRVSILRSDPDSIAAQCSIIADEFKDFGIMRSKLLNLDLLSTKQLEEKIRNSHLEYNEQSGYLKLVTSERELASMAPPPTPGVSKLASNIDPLPFFLRLKGIALAVLALLATLTALIFLVIWANAHHGFNYLTDSLSFRSQLFWSFTPTLIATFIETSWVSLHRDLSVLETWVAIRRRQNRARESLSLRYSSRPPSLVAWMAFKSRHFTLSFVSVLCITTGILNIAMAGLFLSSFTETTSSVSTMSQYTSTTLPNFWGDENDINEAFSILRAEVSDSGKLPAWTTHNVSFVPAQLDAPSAFASANSENEVLTATTAGIGSSLACVTVPNHPTLNESGPGIYTDAQGTKSVRFKPGVPSMGFNQTCTAPYSFVDGVQSTFFQIMDLLNLTTGESSNIDTGGCKNLLLLVSGGTKSQDISLHVCSPSISTSNVEVQYNADQVIMSQQKIDASLSGTAVFTNATEFLSFYVLRFIEASTLSLSLGPTTEYDWPGLLMTRVRNTTTTRSIPELADDTWQRIFAIWFSLYRNNILTARNEGDPSFTTPTGIVTSRQSRIVPSVPAFVISIVLIFLYLIGFIIVCWRRRHRYAGPRMPKTIGSITPWVIHSRMLDDFVGLHYLSSQDRDDVLERMGRRYGFGRFRGMHGRVILGIEHDELLMARGAYEDF
ncbi:hypothetical protein O1611_g4636 [Lasiodiplodia mahajangana]|uniref:Uncharacterized protein n=1 Tax=Lasiodiplodia mahajangana TaxID=1108764 RepID=A0ACC2JP15_9PEZI|nr:hypothetical protein O1611_g4636 [Lasiodiplodia mahajangana]